MNYTMKVIKQTIKLLAIGAALIATSCGLAWLVAFISPWFLALPVIIGVVALAMYQVQQENLPF